MWVCVASFPSEEAQLRSWTQAVWCVCMKYVWPDLDAPLQPAGITPLHLLEKKKKSISVIEIRASISLHNFLTEVSNRFFFLTAPSCIYHQKNLSDSPPTSVPQRPRFIRERLMWLYWVLEGDLHPCLLWDYCLREWEGHRELVVQETWEGETSSCPTN